ncbi:MAG: DEAD/DEAH box helicase [Paludibacteraceae bacterium]|nr:DEAD/DEAH box helicase [Paludibacteraceae bacterium]
MSFDDFNFEYEILDGLDSMNFTTPTPIQEKAIPLLLEGYDLIGCAQTGTGKTAAYTLPLLNNLLIDEHDPSRINAIIMAPTRELAQQIDQQIEGFGYFVPFSSVAVYGGNDSNAWTVQKNGLTRGADIVIATPGRLISHINIYNIDFSGVKYFILDEADRMLDMGFYDDIMTIVKQLPKERQTIMFSATMPPKIKELAHNIMHKPKHVEIAVNRPPESIRQCKFVCYDNQKIPLVKTMMKEQQLSKVLLFAGSKIRVKEIGRELRKAGLKADEMHSDRTQQERDKVMHEFRNGRVDILVATDIVSRGIDIDDIPLVINFDVPRDNEDYVHRIGRTARAESKGIAITLVGTDDQWRMQKIEKFLGYEVPVEQMPGFLGDTPQYNPAGGKTAQHRTKTGHRNGKFRRGGNKNKQKKE